MKIAITSIGRVRDSAVLELEARYLERLRGFADVKLQSIGERSSGSMTPEGIRQREGKEFLKARTAGRTLWVLDETGKQFDSVAFAEMLGKTRDKGGRGLDIAIGGAYGHSDEMRAAADKVISLSPLTFPFQIARLLLVEQLYRARTIIEGSPYHKAG